MKPIEAIHRKLRSLGAVVKDAATTEHERANAKALKTFLEKKLRQEGVPGDWTDVAPDGTRDKDCKPGSASNQWHL
jgi:hypothetical protein